MPTDFEAAAAGQRLPDLRVRVRLPHSLDEFAALVVGEDSLVHVVAARERTTHGQRTWLARAEEHTGLRQSHYV